MANEVEKDTTFLIKKQRFTVQLTFEELQTMMIQVVNDAFQSNVDVFKFWEKYPELMTQKEALEAMNIGRTKFNEMEKKDIIHRHNTQWGIRYKKEELFELVESSNHTSYMRMRNRNRKKSA